MNPDSIPSGVASPTSFHTLQTSPTALISSARRSTPSVHSILMISCHSSIHDEIQVIPDIQALAFNESTDSLIDFIPPSSIIWSDNFDYIIEKTDNIWSQARSRSSHGEISDRRDIIITGRHLEELCSQHRQVFFEEGKRV
ncbi:MAG: hypothetical protein MZV63_52240 [Marinilabiliales bacterium]|nr:hypothetical protein [Marinilabiliales bacterium]